MRFKDSFHPYAGMTILFWSLALTTLLGFSLAREKPDLSTIAGGAVILTGVLIFNFGGRIHDRVFNKKSSVWKMLV